MSTGAARRLRRAIRKAFGAPAAMLMSGHEQGLKAHGDILSTFITGPFWQRWCWLLLGPRITWRLFAKRESDGQTTTS